MLFKQRMFRVKPYTRCVQCIKTDYLKCKSCMDKLVDDVIGKKDSGVPKQILHRSPKYKHLYDNKYPVNMQLTKKSTVHSPSLKHSATTSSVRTSYNKKRQQKYEVYSKYDLWMRQVSCRNDLNNSNTSGNEGNPNRKNIIISQQWPLKKRVQIATDDMQLQQRKFQTWQRKFLQSIKSAQKRQQVQRQINTRTAVPKLMV